MTYAYSGTTFYNDTEKINNTIFTIFHGYPDSDVKFDLDGKVFEGDAGYLCDTISIGGRKGWEMLLTTMTLAIVYI